MAWIKIKKKDNAHFLALGFDYQEVDQLAPTLFAQAVGA